MAEKLLPEQILARATLCGNEYAWRVEDIPAVIDAARTLNLVSLGGQLQFRVPGVGTCECYWVEVDTHVESWSDLPWIDQVSATAKMALDDFERLRKKYDFVTEGRLGFGEHLAAFEARGGNVTDTLCFVWYFVSQHDAFIL